MISIHKTMKILKFLYNHFPTMKHTLVQYMIRQQSSNFTLDEKKLPSVDGYKITFEMFESFQYYKYSSFSGNIVL